MTPRSMALHLLTHAPQDTHDLFATLMVSLRFETNRQFFKSFDYTFTT